MRWLQAARTGRQPRPGWAVCVGGQCAGIRSGSTPPDAARRHRLERVPGRPRNVGYIDNASACAGENRFRAVHHRQAPQRFGSASHNHVGEGSWTGCPHGRGVMRDPRALRVWLCPRADTTSRASAAPPTDGRGASESDAPAPARFTADNWLTAARQLPVDRKPHCVPTTYTRPNHCITINI